MQSKLHKQPEYVLWVHIKSGLTNSNNSIQFKSQNKSRNWNTHTHRTKWQLPKRQKFNCCDWWMAFECNVSSRKAISFVRRKQIPMILTEMGDWSNDHIHIIHRGGDLWFNFTREDFEIDRKKVVKRVREKKVCVRWYGYKPLSEIFNKKRVHQ